MFTSIIENSINLNSMIIICISGIIIGLFISIAYKFQGEYTNNFAITLAVLPLLVATVIIMVNGNLGSGVAIVGAFSLVRFRSIPGSSREILYIFFSMAMGLAIGMGQIVFAFIICIIVVTFSTILLKSKYSSNDLKAKELKVVIPEDLDYTSIFDDIFEKYLTSYELIRVKTIQLGSLIEVSYKIELKDIKDEKKFIDEIRCRNGNLTIVCAKRQVISNEL